MNKILVSLQERRFSCCNYYLLRRSQDILKRRKYLFSCENQKSHFELLFTCVNSTYSSVNKILVSMRERQFSCCNYNLLRRNLEILKRRKYLCSCEIYNYYIDTLFTCIKSTNSTVNKIVVSIQEP